VKIAVPTNDGAALSEHFGRSAAFLVFEIDGAQIKSREMRENQPHHAGSHEDCQHGSGGHGGGHDHGAIVSLLADCDVVLCGGMGRRAAAPARRRRPVRLQPLIV
jgi:predicted Fe-Mo cluster-binding NifX family protein